MDDRLRAWLEARMGLPLGAFPDDGVAVRVSPARSDEPRNRLEVRQVVGRGVLATGIPRVVEALSACLSAMSAWELFSPPGLAEVRRALNPGDAQSLDHIHGLDLALTGHEGFRPARTPHKPVALHKKDIPAEQYALRMGERRPSEKDDFTWAYACYHDDPAAPPTELAAFGPRCASIAIVIWEGSEEIAVFGVGTEEAFRGQGYGLAAVSAATQWVLDQGAVACYGAYADNTPSLRLARRLGYQLFSRSLGA